MNDLDYLRDRAQLEFAIFCIENVARRLGMSAAEVYDLLAVRSSILQKYIVPNFEALHTQGMDYIVDDILEVMREKGVMA